MGQLIRMSMEEMQMESGLSRLFLSYKHSNYGPLQLALGSPLPGSSSLTRPTSPSLTHFNCLSSREYSCAPLLGFGEDYRLGPHRPNHCQQCLYAPP